MTSALAGLWLGLLAEWSLRWGAVLVLLALWLALRPPRSAAVRYALCSAALVAGVLVPFTPRWGPGLSGAPGPTAHKPLVRAQPSPPVERYASARAVTTIGAARESIESRSSPEPVAPVPVSWRLGPVLAPACVVLWAIGVLAVLTRLGAGQIALTRLRRGVGAVGEPSRRLFDEARATLHVTRRVDLVVHPAVLSPVAVGGARAEVLVPPEWEHWPEADRRACLLHELAHLTRYDDLAKLAQELIRAPFFFHPLVHWLLARLDRERELLCDDAVVAHDVDPRAYARVLLACAQHPGRLRTPAPGLPFLNRGTVRLRIQRLLEDDMAQQIAPFPPRAVFAVGVVTLAAALGLGSVRVAARATESDTQPDRATPPVAQGEPSPPGNPTLRATILDPDGKPVEGATVVLGLLDADKPNHHVLTSDKNGRISWPLPSRGRAVSLFGFKEGWAPAVQLRGTNSQAELECRLGKAEAFQAVLVDGAGVPVAGAKVWIESIAHVSEPRRDGERTITSTSYASIQRDIVAGSPLEHLFLTTTDEQGNLSFPSLPPASWLSLAVTARDGRALRVAASKPVDRGRGQSLSDSGFVGGTPGERTQLVAFPAARVTGKVVSKLTGVRVSGRRVFFQASQPNRQVPTRNANFGGWVWTDETGGFAFDNLNEGTINIIVPQTGDDAPWTCRAARDVVLKSGATTEVTIELIRGVAVEGTVVVQGTARPVANARLGVYGPYYPRSSAVTQGTTTDAHGRYRYRLPAGETYLYVMGPPVGFARLAGEGSSQTVTIPEDATAFTIPPIELVPAVAALKGRVLDAQGNPIAGATIIGVCDQFRCIPLSQPLTISSARGEFQMSDGPAIPLGQATHLQVRLPSGEEHQLAIVPPIDGLVTLKVPALGGEHPVVPGPRDIAPDELAGIVVDSAGMPLAGVRVEASYWAPKHPTTRTDRAGVFRLSKLDPEGEYDIRLQKDGYETREYMRRPTGKYGLVVVLGNGTYFEGRVLGSDGAPVPNALIRADGGPMRSGGRVHGETITESRSGTGGRYRLYVVPGEYDIAVRVPGVGVARPPKQAIAADEHRALDIPLAHGANFEARVIDHQTGKPVEGVRLWHWQRPGIEGTSNANGVIQIPELPLGNYPRFEVDAKGYARWWSNEGVTEWSRPQKFASLGGWQRNFDWLDFDVKAGMPPVTIVVDRGVKVTGRVLDPDGKPVAGATVAPALTGTGNSLTGDTRFSVETDAKGGFEVLLPASGDRNYNLVAHDGKFQQWRTWANGVLPPFRTKPGEEVRDVELRLTRPGAVSGRVLDQNGHPVAGREVRASAADQQENRYYDPTTRTRADGRFELRFVRPGEQYIQVEPFYLNATQAPEGTSRTVALQPGESKSGVDLHISDRASAGK